MSSGFSGGPPDFFFNGERSNPFPTNIINNNNNFNLPQQQFSFRSPLAGILPDPDSQIRRPDLIGKRSLAEFQQQQQQQRQQSFFQNQNQQQQQGLGFYLRNVKPRPNYQQRQHHENPSVSLNSVNLRYGRLSILQQQQQQQNLSMPNLGQNKNFVNTAAHETEKRMMNNKLQELEKQLLGDEEEEEETEEISVITNSEWSETIQNLIGAATEKPILPSPTSSSSSCSSPVLPCPKELLIKAATAVSEGKPDVASEILTRLAQVANASGNSEQRLCFYMISALKSRVSTSEFPLKASELCGKEHDKSIQMLYDVSPCFKLGFMAVNLAILEAATEQGFEKIHVLDFDIGQGGQYVHLLHALAARVKGNNSQNRLRITTFADFNGDEKLKTIGEGLRVLANKLGVQLSFHVHNNQSTIDLSRGSLNVQSDEALAVNFAFKLYKLPDESVTTDNLRDLLLRNVKSLNPTVMTVVEQEMNGNTAPLVARVRDACEYYGALLESLDATVDRKRPERVEIESGLSRKMCNSVACEGKDRVERCEVFGKWRARMGMAGFEPRPLSQLVADSLRSKLNSGTRGNPGFGVSELGCGVGFGWMGRTLTVASAWR